MKAHGSDVWARFADNPRRYPNLPACWTRPVPTDDLFGGTDPHPDSWPSWNQEQEDELRKALADLGARAISARPARRSRNSLPPICAAKRASGANSDRHRLAQAAGYLAELADLDRLGAAR